MDAHTWNEREDAIRFDERARLAAWLRAEAAAFEAMAHERDLAFADAYTRAADYLEKR